VNFDILCYKRPENVKIQDVTQYCSFTLVLLFPLRSRNGPSCCAMSAVAHPGREQIVMPPESIRETLPGMLACLLPKYLENASSQAIVSFSI